MMLRWILLAASVIFQSEAGEDDMGDAFVTTQLSVSEVFDGNPLTSDETDRLYKELVDTWGGDLQFGALSQELDLSPKEVPTLSLLDTTALPPLPELGLLPSLPDDGQLPPLPDLGTSFLDLPSLDFGEASGAIPTGWQDLASLDGPGPREGCCVNCGGIALPILPPLPVEALLGVVTSPTQSAFKTSLQSKNQKYKIDIEKYLNSLMEHEDFASEDIRQKVVSEYKKTMEDNDHTSEILDLEKKIEDSKREPGASRKSKTDKRLEDKLRYKKRNLTSLSRLYERLVLNECIQPLPTTYESSDYAIERLQQIKKRNGKKLKNDQKSMPNHSGDLSEGQKRPFHELSPTSQERRYKADVAIYMRFVTESGHFETQAIRQNVRDAYERVINATDRKEKILDLEKRIKNSMTLIGGAYSAHLRSLRHQLYALRSNHGPLSRLYGQLVLKGYIPPLPTTYESCDYARKRHQLEAANKGKKERAASSKSSVRTGGDGSPLPQILEDMEDMLLEDLDLSGLSPWPLQLTPDANDPAQSESPSSGGGSDLADFEPSDRGVAERQRNKRALEVSDLEHFAEHLLKLLGEPYVMEEMSSDEIISDRLKSALAVGHYSKHPRYDAEDIDAIGQLCHRLIEKRVVPELDVEGARRKKRALASAPAAAPPPAPAAAPPPALPDFNEDGQNKKGRSYHELGPKEKEARQKKLHATWIEANLDKPDVREAYSAIKNDPKRLEKIEKLEEAYRAAQLMKDSAARDSQLKSLKDSILETKTAREELSALCEQLILDQTIKPIPPNFAIRHGVNVFSRSDIFFTGMQTNTKARTGSFKPYDQLKDPGKHKRQVNMRIAWIKANLNKPDVRKAYKAITADPERLEKIRKLRAERQASKYIEDPRVRTRKDKALENKIFTLRKATTELYKVYEKLIEEGALPPVPPSFAEEWCVPRDCIKNLQALDDQRKRASSPTVVEGGVLKRRRVNVESPDLTPSSVSASVRSVFAPDAHTEQDMSNPILCAQGEKTTTSFHEFTIHQQRVSITKVFVDWLELHKEGRDIQEKYRELREESHSPKTLRKKLKDLCIALIYEGKIPEVTEQFAMESQGVPFHRIKMGMARQHPDSVRSRKEHSARQRAASAAPALAASPMGFSPSMWPLNNPSAPFYHPMTPVFPGYGVPFQMGPYGQQVAHVQMMPFWPGFGVPLQMPSFVPGYGVPVQMAQTPLLQQWTAPFNRLASAPAEMDVDDSGSDN